MKGLRAVLTGAFLVPVSIVGCRSKTQSQTSPAQAAPESASDSLHFSDSFYELDYPPDFKVTATLVGKDEWLAIAPKAPPGGSTVGEGTIQTDPVHPDMLPEDEIKSYAATISSQGKRILGGIRTLAVKNGTCKGFVEVDPGLPCPPRMTARPASGTCNDATLYAFCKTPANKRLVYSAQLGIVPTTDKVTQEAASFGKTHERILSTLEFK